MTVTQTQEKSVPTDYSDTDLQTKLKALVPTEALAMTLSKFV